MIKIKNQQQIEIMREGGQILSRVLDLVIKKVKPGIGTEELNVYAEELIAKAGGRASFKNYKAPWTDILFPSALCLSINNEVVHGLPVPNRYLKTGDILGIDCGLEYKGLYTDMARTVAVGKIDRQAKKLLQVTEEALHKGIKQAKIGNKLSDISRAIETHIAKNNFNVVRQLVGHGVGFSAHEDPSVFNYVDKKEKDIILTKGMT
ncbi:MAG: type I methionyl aminopeptidase, partial [bacterium]